MKAESKQRGQGRREGWAGPGPTAEVEVEVEVRFKVQARITTGVGGRRLRRSGTSDAHYNVLGSNEGWAAAQGWGWGVTEHWTLETLEQEPTSCLFAGLRSMCVTVEVLSPP